MKSCRTFLRIASAILAIIGGLVALTSINIYVIFSWIIAVLLWMFSTMDDEKLKQQKTLLFIITIVLIIPNFLASIFIAIALSDMSGTPTVTNQVNAPPPVIKKKKEIDPEVKKIDTLLKLGAGMILISGILFATTSWNFISDIGKLFFLLLFSAIFLGLSYFTEIKLKLYNTSFIYWILSMGFLLFIIIAILFFQIAGPYISYVGIGSNLAYGITCLTFSGLALATYLKYGRSQILYLVYAGLYITIAFFLSHYFEYIIALLLLSTMFFIVSIQSKKDSILFKWNKIASYIILLGVLSYSSLENKLSFLLLAFIITSNHFYLASLAEKDDDKIPSLWISHTLMPFAIYNCSFFNEYKYLIIFLLAAMFAFLIKEKIINTNDTYQQQHFILNTIISILCILLVGINTTLGLTISILYLGLIIYLESKEVYQQSNYFEPISVALLITSLCSQPYFDTTFTFICTFTSIVYCILHYLTQEKRKEIYWIYIIGSTILSLIGNLINIEKWLSLIIFIPSIYLFYATKLDKNITDIKEKLAIIFIVILFSIYNFFYIINWFELSVILSSVLFIWILGMIIILTEQNNIKTISYFSIVVPLFKMISEIQDDTIRLILVSTLILYIDFLLLKFVITDSSNKNTIGLIGIIIAILYVLPSSDYIIGVYIGIIGIATIMIGYMKKEYKSFFTGGIIITILNIIYQLRNLWEQIPFWLYLLIGGLSLIGFVTYKELNNKK